MDASPDPIQRLLDRPHPGWLDMLLPFIIRH
jgi:hypothetical protein